MNSKKQNQHQNSQIGDRKNKNLSPEFSDSMLMSSAMGTKSQQEEEQASEYKSMKSF